MKQEVTYKKCERCGVDTIHKVIRTEEKMSLKCLECGYIIGETK